MPALPITENSLLHSKILLCFLGNSFFPWAQPPHSANDRGCFSIIHYIRREEKNPLRLFEQFPHVIDKLHHLAKFDFILLLESQKSIYQAHHLVLRYAEIH